MSSGPQDGGTYAENLRSACLEARNTMDKQVELIQREDDKAIKLLRVNILTLGVLASGLSITVQAEAIPVDGFFNFHIGAGIIVMLFSSVIASMAYTSSRVELGINPQAVIDADGMNRKAFLERLSKEYAQWIRRNQVVHRFNAYAITWAIILAISGIVFFVGGFGVGLMQIRGTLLSELLFLLELSIGSTVVSLLFHSDELFDQLMYNGRS